mgnify:FL=1
MSLVIVKIRTDDSFMKGKLSLVLLFNLRYVLHVIHISFPYQV